MTDLAEVLAVRTELEYLRCRRTVRRSCNIAAIEHKDVSFRVDRNSGGFAEMQVRRKLEEVRHGVERYLWHGLLSKQHRTPHQEQGNDDAFHFGLL